MYPQAILMTDKNLKVGFIQTSPVFGKVKKNIEKYWKSLEFYGKKWNFARGSTEK